MKFLPRFSVHNPVLMNLCMVVVFVAGAYSGLTIVREMFPESRPHRILIATAYPGATPREVEKGITIKIEEKVKDVEGVERILTTITEGNSRILIEMESGFGDLDQAVNDVKAAVDTILPEDFPDEALETSVVKFEPTWPVIGVALYGTMDDRALKTLGERLKDDVLELPGITEVVLTGTRKDEISVEVRPAKLIEFGVSLVDVGRAIAASNLDLPAGQVRTAQANVAVRTLGEKDRGEELLDIVIRSDPGGRAVRLRDVATVVDGFEDVEIAGRYFGQPAANLTVYKKPDQDAIAIATYVRALVAGKMGDPLKRTWLDRLLAGGSGADPVQQVYDRAKADPYPLGIQVTIHTDLSRFIEGRLDLLMRNGAWGLLLVALSLLVFLHWRIAFWVMLGLLLSIAGSLVCLQALGQTLNMFTMFGLIIVLGMLVDDAIIVSEHVYTKLERGVEPKLAAVTGTQEVTWPVVCAILTTIVAFIPLMFIEGQIGDWTGVLPVVVCVALTVSLVEALTILPAHLAHSLHPPAAMDEDSSKRAKGALRGWVARARKAQSLYVQQRLVVAYEKLLRATSMHRYVTMAALLACLIVVSGVVAGGHVPFVFLQKMDTENIQVSLKMHVGTPIDATQAAAAVIEQAVMDLPELRTLYTLLGKQLDDEQAPTAPQSHVAQLFIELIPSEQRTRTSDEIIRVIREKTKDLPGVRGLRFTAMDGGPVGAAIHLDISSQRMEDLITASKEIRGRLATFSGVYDIVDDFGAGRREVQIEAYEAGRALGLTNQSLAAQIRAAFHGYEARKVQRDQEDVRIMVRFPPEHRTRISDIESMRVATPAGHLVPLTEVARLTESTGFASIKRKNHRRTITITADADTSVTGAGPVIEALTGRLSDLANRYPGMVFEFGGQKLELQKAVSSLKRNFLAALLMVYVILAGLFRSYLQPVIVMAVIPLGVIGAVVGHYLMGYPLTVLSMIGLVALSGIVVNDSMVLVVFINRRIADGTPVFDAVLEGGKSRLRPILLTTVTTVLGIAPLLTEQSFQAKFLIPMAISIAAGIVFATLLTLVAVPALFLILDDIKRIPLAAMHRAIGKSPHPATSPTSKP